MKIIKTSAWGRNHPWHEKLRNRITERTHKTSIERDGIELEVEVTYSFEPGDPKTHDNPGWPASVELYKTVDEFDNEINLTEGEHERIEDEISRYLEDYFTTPPDIEPY